MGQYPSRHSANKRQSEHKSPISGGVLSVAELDCHGGPYDDPTEELSGFPPVRLFTQLRLPGSRRTRRSAFFLTAFQEFAHIGAYPPLLDGSVLQTSKTPPQKNNDTYRIKMDT